MLILVLWLYEYVWRWTLISVDVMQFMAIYVIKVKLHVLWRFILGFGYRLLKKLLKFNWDSFGLVCCFMIFHDDNLILCFRFKCFEEVLQIPKECMLPLYGSEDSNVVLVYVKYFIVALVYFKMLHSFLVWIGIFCIDLIIEKRVVYSPCRVMMWVGLT